MKLRMYFKQAWYNLRMNRVYSAVFIAGTALSLSLVMAFLTVLSSRVVNTVPETHRDRMMVLKSLAEMNDGSYYQSGVTSKFAEQFMMDVPGVEAWSLTSPAEGGFVVLESGEEEVTKVYGKYVDLDFWKVFDYDFIEGRAISQNGMVPNTAETVISESTARSLFGRTDAVGETVYFGGHTMTVCGVVRDVPMSAATAFAGVWLPQSLSEDSGFSPSGLLGMGTLLILAEDRSDFGIIKEEITGRVSRYAEANGITMELKSFDSYRKSLFAWSELSSAAYTWLGIGVVLIILIVPLLNLSGMVGSRMEARLTEFGTRKSFGAGPRSIIAQIAGENLLMTIIGGVVGLLAAWLIIALFSRQLNSLVPGSFMDNISQMGEIPDSGFFDFRDFFKLWLYLALLGIILVLNLVSALIPAAKVIRRPITESLNYKK
ncbi:putative uncharacterized protein [Alistipes sp. CAG:831]|nr:putative uncharacterized protein [Alistipes sp. CAG:831]